MDENNQPNLNQNPQVNVVPNPNVNPTVVNPMSVNTNKSSLGSIIGTIIIIAVIILGGLYFWGKRIDEAKMNQELVSGQTETTVTEEDENLEANTIKSVTSSDELDSIEADLKATNLDGLGAELEAELE